jgi:hypothetical protein
MTTKTTWRSNILPPKHDYNLSLPVLCKTEDKSIVLQYDHDEKTWFDPQHPSQDFKSKVVKWCNIPK